MHALGYTFWHPESTVTALETALWGVDPDDTRFVTKEMTNNRFAQVPSLRDLLNCVMILERTH
jgi:hypothetical protein